MPRNYVLILVPEIIEEEILSEYVQNIFLPFGRDYNFPPFVCPCDCNRSEERIDFANKNTRHFHQFWRSYNMLLPENRSTWKEFISAWEEAALSSQSHFPIPDPACETCKGLGCFTTTFYPLNMYDYWVGLKEENLGRLAKIKTEWKTVELPNGQQRIFFQLVTPFQKPFMFYHVITPDGLPYNRWDYSNEQEWHEIWENLTQQWQNSMIIRCLVHE